MSYPAGFKIRSNIEWIVQILSKEELSSEDIKLLCILLNPPPCLNLKIIPINPNATYKVTKKWDPNIKFS